MSWEVLLLSRPFDVPCWGACTVLGRCLQYYFGGRSCFAFMRWVGAPDGDRNFGGERNSGGERRKSLTRLRVVREGFACGQLVIIQCKRVLMSSLERTPSRSRSYSPQNSPESSKNFVRAVKATPILMSVPVSHAMQTRCVFWMWSKIKGVACGRTECRK